MRILGIPRYFSVVCAICIILHDHIYNHPDNIIFIDKPLSDEE